MLLVLVATLWVIRSQEISYLRFKCHQYYFIVISNIDCSLVLFLQVSLSTIKMILVSSSHPRKCALTRLPMVLLHLDSERNWWWKMKIGQYQMRTINTLEIIVTLVNRNTMYKYCKNTCQTLLFILKTYLVSKYVDHKQYNSK